MIQIGFVDISTLEDSQYRKLYAQASPERQHRADRYLRTEDRYRCIVAGALLRYALGGTDHAEPVRTPEGKPYLPGREDFHFNLSHSGQWVVIAWGSRPMGIDVETLSMDEGKEQLARRFFSSDEQAYLFAVEGQDRARRFFEIWTKKESYLKYLGTGINRPLNAFSVLDTTALAASFRSFFFEDAVMTLCAERSECESRPVPLKSLFFE